MSVTYKEMHINDFQMCDALLIQNMPVVVKADHRWKRFLFRLQNLISSQCISAWTPFKCHCLRRGAHHRAFVTWQMCARVARSPICLNWGVMNLLCPIWNQLSVWLTLFEAGSLSVRWWELWSSLLQPYLPFPTLGLTSTAGAVLLTQLLVTLQQ